MMNLARRAVFTRVVQHGVVPRVPVTRMIARGMVDLRKKELGEEEIYIRQQENMRAEKVRKQMEEILKRDKSDPIKQSVLQTFDPEHKRESHEVGIFQYYGLDDWRYALPWGATFGACLTAAGVINFDLKMLHVAVFMVSWHVYDALILPLWTEKTWWFFGYFEEFWTKLDKYIANQLDSSITTNEKFLDVKDTFNDIFAVTDDIKVVQAEALTLAKQNELRSAIVKKLDALAALNEATQSAIRVDLLRSVKSEASKIVSTDRKLKDSILNQAIATLAAGKSGKRGKDHVAEAFLTAINNYKKNVGNKDSGVSKIAANLEKDIAEIIKPPQISSTAAGH